jgi:hypothetical protein
MKEGFKHWVGVKLTSPIIEGTVSAGTGLTMPAFTGSGDISLGAHRLGFTGAWVKDSGFGDVGIRNAADDAYYNLRVSSLYVHGSISLAASGATIATSNVDGYTVLFRARDTGVGLVDVAMLQSAADPYFQLTLGAVFAPIAQPAAPVEGWLIYNSASHKLQVRTAAAWETIVSA